GSNLVFASRVAVKNEQFVPAGNDPRISPGALKAGSPLILTNTTPPHWTLSGVFAHGFGPGAWKNGKVSWESDRVFKTAATKMNQLFILDLKEGTVRQLTQDD